MSETTRTPEPPGRDHPDQRPQPGPTSSDAPSREEQLVLVQFKGHRKGYYHNRRNLEVTTGQYCLVEADRGRDMGRVTYVGPGKQEWWKLAANQGVLQIAGPEDLKRLHENRGDEWEFWDICQEKIQARRLKMNLVTVERQFDHKKITFYFTAEKRVDFRELVRDLAAIFRTRIELRQIGVRDEARLKGGLGVCGREYCCSTFLHEFIPVTLKMAKVQQLPLNPGKLSGPCGRLRCCMTYENDTYREARGRLPRIGTLVETPDGTGTVRRVDLLAGRVGVAHPGLEGLRDWAVGELTWDTGSSITESGGPGRNGGCNRSTGGHH
jgi:cell fate regulator YaaT (PSP1 superfamily)